MSRRFIALSRQSFSPLALPCFSTVRFRRVFSGFLYAGVIGGLCRRAALPVRALPPADLFRPRAGFHVKQTRTPRCFMSSTASRVNSRPHPLPGCLFHLSVLNDYLARTLPPARWYPCQTNKSFSSPSGLYNVAPFVSGTRAKQTRASRHPMFLTAAQAFSHTLCAPRIANAQQHIKTTSHPRFASKPEVAAHACFYA